jgi:hypothetical protein
VVQHGDNLMRRKRKQIKGRKRWEEKKERALSRFQSKFNRVATSLTNLR